MCAWVCEEWEVVWVGGCEEWEVVWVGGCEEWEVMCACVCV